MNYTIYSYHYYSFLKKKIYNYGQITFDSTSFFPSLYLFYFDLLWSLPLPGASLYLEKDGEKKRGKEGVKERRKEEGKEGKETRKEEGKEGKETRKVRGKGMKK